MLSETRDLKAARRFFRGAHAVVGRAADRVPADGHSRPHQVCDGLGWSPDGAIPQRHKFTLDQGNYYQERIDRAHRRYLSAIKLLATVRKLAQPSLQVNVANQQVNLTR